MLAVLIIVAIGLAGAGLMLLQRKQNRRRSSGNTYFTQTLGIDKPAPSAAKDDPPAA